MSGKPFTPRTGVTSNERYKLQLSDEDNAKVMRGQKWEAIVTDIVTGVQYQARGAACSARPECFCDAIAEPLRTETIYSTMVWPAVNLDGADEKQDIADRLREAADDIARALALLTAPEVDLADVDWDKRGGYGLLFETIDERAAKTLDFGEMLRPGEQDAEPTPWAVEA